jgi:hypothetical protein
MADLFNAREIQFHSQLQGAVPGGPFVKIHFSYRKISIYLSER